MRTLLVIALMAVAMPAHAQHCDVVVVHAPDEVRAEIDRWLHDEPRCTISLEVRVVPTTGGLYLFARDNRGFTRQRTVADAATAGALIASWAADDTIDGVWIPVVPTRPPSAPALAPTPMPALTTTPDRDRSVLQPFGIGFAVAGGLAIAGSAYYGVRAKQISNEIGDHPASEPWSLDIYEREQQGMLYERRALALLIGGGALVATGTVMYLVGRSRNEHWTVAATTTRGGAAVSLAGHF